MISLFLIHLATQRSIFTNGELLTIWNIGILNFPSLQLANCRIATHQVLKKSRNYDQNFKMFFLKFD